MKRVFIILLTAAALLCLAACGRETQPENAGIVPAQEADDAGEGEFVLFSDPDASEENIEMPDTGNMTEQAYIRYEGTVLSREDRPSEKVFTGAGTVVNCLGIENGKARLELNGTVYSCSPLYIGSENSALNSAARETMLLEFSASGTFTPVEPIECRCIVEGLNCRNLPSLGSEILCKAKYGDKLTVVGYDGRFCLCILPETEAGIGGGLAFCWMDYVSGFDMPFSLENAVMLGDYLPDARYNLLFCTDYNVAGRPLYPAVPILETETARILKQAFDIFKKDGYTMIICDAYRPVSAQYILYEVVDDYRYIADPYRGYSWHQYGRAVDIMLWDDEANEELELPTAMHAFVPEAARRKHASWTAEAEKNSDYMTSVMESVGFSTIATEWWHFERTEEGDYLDPEIQLSALNTLSASEWLAAVREYAG